MSTVRYLLDEHVPRALPGALTGRQPQMDVLVVGRAGAPPKGTPDPDLLRVAEAERRALVTMDKRTMLRHVANHLAGGAHTWGVFMLRMDFANWRYVDDLALIWAASEAEDWRDRIEWLPW